MDEIKLNKAFTNKKESIPDTCIDNIFYYTIQEHELEDIIMKIRMILTVVFVFLVLCLSTTIRTSNITSLNENQQNINSETIKNNDVSLGFKLSASNINVSQPYVVPLMNGNYSSNYIDIGGITALSPTLGYLTDSTAVDHYVEIYYVANDTSTGLKFNLSYIYEGPANGRLEIQNWFAVNVSLANLTSGTYYFRAFFSDGTNSGDSGRPQSFQNIIYRNVTQKTVDQGWPATITQGCQNSNIITADLNNNGQKEIIFVKYGCFQGQNSSINVLDLTGKELPGWPQIIKMGNYWVGQSAPPSVVDLNGDGQLEVLVDGLNGYIYAYNYTGSLMPNFPLKIGTITDRSYVVPCDINHDGKAEIFAITSNQNTYDAYVWGFSSTGENLTGYPYQITSSSKNVEISNLAIADLNNDGSYQLIFQYNLVTMALNTDLSVDFSYTSQATQINTLPQVIVKDVNNDGKLEILSDFGSSIQLVSNTGNLLFYKDLPVRPFFNVNYSPYTIQFADLNQDHQDEIIINCYQGQFPFTNSTTYKKVVNSLLIYSNSGNLLKTISIYSRNIFVAFGIGDINGDNKPELLLTGKSGLTGYLDSNYDFHVFKNFKTNFEQGMISLDDLNYDGKLDLIMMNTNNIAVFKTSIAYDPNAAQLKFYMHDRYNSNNYGNIVPPTIAFLSGTQGLDTGYHFKGFFKDEFGSIASTEFKINSKLQNPLTLSSNGSFDSLQTLTSGTYNFSLKVTDNAGNVLTWYKEITIIATPKSQTETFLTSSPSTLPTSSSSTVLLNSPSTTTSSTSKQAVNVFNQYLPVVAGVILILVLVLYIFRKKK